MQHIFFDGVAAIGNRLATSEFPARLDVDAHQRCCDNAGIDSHIDGERVVHGRAGIAELLAELDEELSDLVNEVVDWAVSLAKLREIFAGE